MSAISETCKRIMILMDNNGGRVPDSVVLPFDLYSRCIAELYDHPSVKERGFRVDSKGRPLLMGVGLEPL